MRWARAVWTLPAVIAIALLATGCASTAGSAKALTAAPRPESLAQYSKLAVTTSTLGERTTAMTQSDRERIAAAVVRRVHAQAPSRFAELAVDTTDASTLHVTIAFTRYDAGSEFARFMLAGLGQIHIDAEVTLEDRSVPRTLGRYEVTKTFAWGGMYGVMTGIKDVEEGFAEAVARVVLGEAD